MSIRVIQRPIKTNCNFNAIGNPIVFHLRRYDHAVTQVNNNGGFAQLQIVGSLTSYYQNNNYVYIDVNGYFVQAKITATGTSGGNTLVTTDVAYNGTDSGYVFNSTKRTDHRVEVEVYNAATNVKIGSTISRTPDITGDFRFDISSRIAGHTLMEFSAPVTNEADPCGLSVYIKYQEYYDSAYQVQVNDSANPVIGVLAAMPLYTSIIPLVRYEHGGNMLDFYMTSNIKNWLHKTSHNNGEVAMWRGWPFTLSFLWPASIAGMKLRKQQYDVTSSLLSTTDIALTATLSKVNRVSIGAVNASAKKIVLTLLNSADDSVISKSLTVKVEEPCNNPVHLFWKNTYGGDAYWQFGYSQEYEQLSTSGKKMSRLTLFANNITFAEWEHLNDLFTPGDVFYKSIVDMELSSTIDKTSYKDDQQIYLLSSDGLSKVGVISVNKTQLVYTKNRLHSNFEVTIELPETFTL